MVPAMLPKSSLSIAAWRCRIQIYNRWLSSTKIQEKFTLAIDIHRTSIYILVLLIYNYGAHGKYKLVLQTYNFKTTTELDIAAINLQSIEFISYFILHLPIYKQLDKKEADWKAYQIILLLPKFSYPNNQPWPWWLCQPYANARACWL